jgi:hypothetical protein
MFYYEDLAVVDLLGRTLLYNVVLHELFHAFGVGSSWFLPNWNSEEPKIYRSYIIGVGDESDPDEFPGVIGNMFYNTYDNGTRLETDYGTEPIPGRGDASYPTAYGVARSTLTEIGSATRYYSEYFNSHITPTPTNNLVLTAVPVENRMGAGSYGAHWAEGSLAYESWSGQGVDGRYIGVSTCPAPVLFDELMTPISEGSWTVTPITKISLGALYDVGWVVDTSLADNWLPTTHILHYNTINHTASVDLYCTGGMSNNISIQRAPELMASVMPIRAGVRYTLINNPTSPMESNYRLTLIKVLPIVFAMPGLGPVISLSSEWEEEWVTSSTSPYYQGKGMLTFKPPLSTTPGASDFFIFAYDPAVGLPEYATIPFDGNSNWSPNIVGVGGVNF